MTSKVDRQCHDERGPDDGGLDDEAGHAPRGLSLVLVQLGFHLARRFGELLAPLGLEQRHAGMLGRLAASEGKSQQAVGEQLGLNATRMVFLVDELEQRGLVERRRNPSDRRSHALYLTDQGRDMIARVRQVTGELEQRLGTSLTEFERAQLAVLLRQVAEEQGLSPQSLPGTIKPTAPPSRG
jgi:DNA-binding MarR family transcriptional regulator